MTKLYLLLLASGLSLAACKTATKAYNKGDYADAIELGVKKLQKDPFDRETLGLVKSAYGFAVNHHEETIRALSARTDDDRHEAVLREYVRLQDLYETVQQSPAAAKAVQPRNYAEAVQTYRDKAADVHLAAAERWMDEGSKLSFRRAYNEFRSALRFRDNAAIRARRDEAFNAALTKVLVVPIRNRGGFGYHSDFRLQSFQTDVMRSLSHHLNDGFVRFYSEWDLRQRELEPDQVLELNLGRIRLGRPSDQVNRREVTKQVVVKEIVYRPDSVVKQYGTVRAVIATTTRTMLSDGELYLSLRDVRGRLLWEDRFTGEHRWQTEFAAYTGDERALTDNDKALLNRPQQPETVGEDEIMRQLYAQIQNDLAGRLRGYFSRW